MTINFFFKHVKLVVDIWLGHETCYSKTTDVLFDWHHPESMLISGIAEDTKHHHHLISQ